MSLISEAHVCSDLFFQSHSLQEPSRRAYVVGPHYIQRREVYTELVAGSYLRRRYVAVKGWSLPDHVGLKADVAGLQVLSRWNGAAQQKLEVIPPIQVDADSLLFPPVYARPLMELLRGVDLESHPLYLRYRALLVSLKETAEAQGHLTELMDQDPVYLALKVTYLTPMGHLDRYEDMDAFYLFLRGDNVLYDESTDQFVIIDTY